MGMCGRQVVGRRPGVAVLGCEGRPVGHLQGNMGNSPADELRHTPSKSLHRAGLPGSTRRMATHASRTVPAFTACTACTACTCMYCR